MFIKQINKKNNDGTKQYIQHRLVESYRTEKGPRQRTLLNLGTLSLPREQWKLLPYLLVANWFIRAVSDVADAEPSI
jgi:hypothetical protein